MTKNIPKKNICQENIGKELSRVSPISCGILEREGEELRDALGQAGSRFRLFLSHDQSPDSLFQLRRFLDKRREDCYFLFSSLFGRVLKRGI